MIQKKIEKIADAPSYQKACYFTAFVFFLDSFLLYTSGDGIMKITLESASKQVITKPIGHYLFFLVSWAALYNGLSKLIAYVLLMIHFSSDHEKVDEQLDAGASITVLTITTLLNARLQDSAFWYLNTLIKSMDDPFANMIFALPVLALYFVPIFLACGLLIVLTDLTIKLGKYILKKVVTLI